MTQDQIMELVQVYTSAWALVGSRFDNGNGMADALEAKAAVVAALEALTKDAERYRVGREAEYAGLMPTFIRPGKTWADAMDSAYDAAMKEHKRSRLNDHISTTRT